MTLVHVALWLDVIWGDDPISEAWYGDDKSLVWADDYVTKDYLNNIYSYDEVKLAIL